jgi:SOS-response transcriptional repressor LexA
LFFYYRWNNLMLMTTLASRVQMRMAVLDLTQDEVAARAGISQTAIQKIISGKTKETRKIMQLAQALECNAVWLGTGNENPETGMIAVNAILPGLSGSIAMESNVSPGPTVHGKVPLISWVQAGHASEVVDLLHPGDGYEWIDTTCQIRRHTYALRVQGDSMTPDFPEGCIIVVEPELDPLPGDFVIARNGDDEATFKQLIKDGADFYLKPLNERYPIKPLGHYHVIGVVRELVRRFR